MAVRGTVSARAQSNNRLKQIFLITFIFVCGGVSIQAQTAAVKKQILNRIIQFGEITPEEVKERGGVGKVLNIQSVDLNRDGKPEYIVVCECSLGATPFVFRNTTRELKIYLSARFAQPLRCRKVTKKAGEILNMKREIRPVINLSPYALTEADTKSSYLV